MVMTFSNPELLDLYPAHLETTKKTVSPVRHLLRSYTVHKDRKLGGTNRSKVELYTEIESSAVRRDRESRRTQRSRVAPYTEIDSRAVHRDRESRRAQRSRVAPCTEIRSRTVHRDQESHRAQRSRVAPCRDRESRRAQRSRITPCRDRESLRAQRSRAPYTEVESCPVHGDRKLRHTHRSKVLQSLQDLLPVSCQLLWLYTCVW